MSRPINCGGCNKPKRPKGKKFRKLPGYCECGRPTVMSKEVLQKLEDAFMFAFSDEKACAYAGINPRTLYNYQNENPQFIQRKEQLKLRPDLKAQETIVKSLNNPNHAWRWLEKRDKAFMPVSKVEHAGSIELADTIEQISEEELKALDILRKARRKRIEEQSKEKKDGNDTPI